ncbi:MAG: secretin N-terminal domain-containing protein [Phycisphaerales bacterium]|nr:secretin N-terminal domain-containing protein [Phycisphaerales bacterium]
MRTTVSKTVLMTLVAGLALPLAAQPPATQPEPAPASPTPAPAPENPAPAEQPPTPETAPAPETVPTAPAQPATAPAADPPVISPATVPPAVAAIAATDPLGRRISTNASDTVLAFPKATVEQIIPFIVESTGKVVMPSQTVLPIRITVINDKPIPRSQALDLVFFALQQAGVAVIENKDYIILVDQTKLSLNSGIQVIGADVSVLPRKDLGSVVQKVFLLKHASAANLADIIKGSVPENAAISADNDSSQLLVTSSIASLQRVERMIIELDRPPADMPKSETFHLQYANPEDVATWITALFGDTTNNPNRARNNQPAQNNAGGRLQGAFGGQRGGAPGAGAAPAADAGSGARLQATPTSSILRVTSNKLQNSVTVVAEANILELIRRQITQEWDKRIAAPIFTSRIYQLQYQDPIKIKANLEGIFGTGTTGGGGQNRQTQSALANQFTFQALPESGRVIVVGKTEDNLELIDQLIKDLDTPMLTGLPDIIELKHIQAEDLAEQLNALLAQEGTLAQVRRVNTDLRTGANAGASPFSSDATTSADGSSSQSTTNQDLMQFWWQRARPATDNFGASNLVAKARIVPIAKQNSIMVMAPLEYKAALRSLIDSLDKPGRQVLIAAIIAEISGENAMSVGLRWSNSTITPTKQDNSISVGPRANNANTITGTQNNFLPDLFSTSVLDVGANINVLLQLLSQETKVNILSEPKIFTGDNQEAAFFDGQDIPFITDSQPNTNGNLVQSFDYRAVGINLRVRPRITPERDVDLKVNLELSNIQPQQTLFGGFVVDRRETTTQLIVKDGQTVIMSGILRSEDSDIVRKVPGIGDVPLIGELFKSRERIKSTTELIAFITPLVVNSQADSDKVNEAPRKRLDQLRKELSVPSSQGIDQGPAPADVGKPDPEAKPEAH